MTTPEEAKVIAKKLNSPAMPKGGENARFATECAAAVALTSLANQVERLEAQRKELREALEEAFDLSNDPKIYNKIYAALKATE